MTNQIKKYLTVLTLLSLSLCINAQNKQFSVSPTVGVATTILDSGTGFHIGVNPSYALSSKFSIEGQVSYLYTKSSGFLNGDGMKSNSFNTLLGGRLYLNAAEKATRFYLNLLVGGNYNEEEINGVKDDGEFTIGFSGGGFFEFNKFLIGVSFDTPQHLILKVGYVF